MAGKWKKAVCEGCGHRMPRRIPSDATRVTCFHCVMVPSPARMIEMHAMVPYDFEVDPFRGGAIT